MSVSGKFSNFSFPPDGTVPFYGVVPFIVLITHSTGFSFVDQRSQGAFFGVPSA